jgi:AcrR family transcriptional regulator
MAPRAYNNETRLQLQDELKGRIAEAAAALHAEKGALATSWAEIAQRAGVSLPTVYKHFPTLDALIPACTGHVAAHAPALPVADIVDAGDLATAAQALVDGIDRLNAYFEPWQSWREQHHIPALKALADERRVQLTSLISRVLAAHLGARAGRELPAVWESLLHFDLWHRLFRQHGLSRAATRKTIFHLLLAAAGPQPAASPSPRPTSRK